MNAEHLLEHYERIADAPDAIARLRRFVLDLAVRGKLMPQDPSDEPAPELLKRIAKEKVEQADLPKGWRKAKVGSILDFQYGKGLKASERADEGPVPVFGSNGIVGFTDEPLTVRPSIIIGRKGSAGALNLCDGPSWTTDVAYFVDTPSFIEIRFLLNALKALDLDKLGKGVKPGLSRSEAYEQIINIPPLAEQHRIVAKVDELMVLCDRLESAQAGREATRDRLALATLARLNAPDPVTFHADARFALETLPALTTRPDQIKQLRQTILNLAVRGKLVPQDANDEPASELLKEISKTRKRLYSEKKIPKPKELPSIDEIEPPFTLPFGWAWSTLGDLCFQVSDGPHFSPQYVTPDQGVPFLSTRNIRLNGFDLGTVKYVSRADHEEFCKRIRPEMDDIIYTKGGTTGIAKVNDLDFEFSVWVHLAVLRIEKKRLYPRYVELALNSPHCYEQSQRYTQGTSNFDLGLTRMIKITVPLPPLAEQQRIVAKVDALMALCDRLEASLDAAGATRRRLLDALLAEALAPSEARELEMVE